MKNIKLTIITILAMAFMGAATVCADNTADYKDLYLEFAKEEDNNASPQSVMNIANGMIMVDLNKDSIPELFLYGAADLGYVIDGAFSIIDGEVVREENVDFSDFHMPFLPDEEVWDTNEFCTTVVKEENDYFAVCHIKEDGYYIPLIFYDENGFGVGYEITDDKFVDVYDFVDLPIATVDFYDEIKMQRVSNEEAMQMLLDKYETELKVSPYKMAGKNRVSAWAFEEVEQAKNQDIIPGEMYDDDLTQRITRAEFCAIAVKLYEGMSKTQPGVTDVNIIDIDGNIYEDYIRGAYNLGITKGTNGTEVEDVTFSPDLNITREQLATMLARTIKISKYEDSEYPFDISGTVTFADDNEISGYARESVYYMNQNDIIKGMDDTHFAPGRIATKEQAILIALRIYNKEILGQEDNDGETKTEPVDYETAYLEYIENNVQYFTRGMMLCDLNDDDIPELFSIAYDEEGDLVYYHELKDGKVIAPSDTTVKTYIDISNLIKPTTFFENPWYFMGIYKNKETGQKALINSIGEGSEDDRFDVIAYDGETLVLKDEGVKRMDGYIWPIDEKRDSVMCNYELSEDKLYTSFLLRGEFGGEYGNDPVETLKGLIADFEKGDNSIEYDEATDGEFLCYIRNMTETEMELIPVAYINYEEYQKAINSDNMFELNGEMMNIQIDEIDYEEYGYIYLHQMPDFTYTFYEPEEGEPSVIEGYSGNKPVKVKLSDDLIIKYPKVYSKEGKDTYTLDEYLPRYGELTLQHYHNAVIKNNELVLLDVIYTE